MRNGNDNTEALEVIEAEYLDGTQALSAITSAEIDQQIATAHRYPRSITQSRLELTTLATMDEEVAASMFYALPRSGKAIEGPSARLAEAAINAWGNMRAEADIASIDDKHITAVATCFDLQKNVAVRVRVKRGITGRDGRRYKDDMIVVTGNAAMSIALRNAIFKVIPFAFIKPAYEAARQASIGQGGTMAQKRQKAFDTFAKMGITPDRVLSRIGLSYADDVGEEELISLRGLLTALRDGDTTVEEAFPVAAQEVKVATQAKLADLKARIQAKQEEAPALPAGEEAVGIKPARQQVRELRQKVEEKAEPMTIEQEAMIDEIATHPMLDRSDLKSLEGWFETKPTKQQASEEIKRLVAMIAQREKDAADSPEHEPAGGLFPPPAIPRPSTHVDEG
jgi:hypothetical protein